jgi:hypothetical protein
MESIVAEKSHSQQEFDERKQQKIIIDKISNCTRTFSKLYFYDSLGLTVVHYYSDT